MLNKYFLNYFPFSNSFTPKYLKDSQPRALICQELNHILCGDLFSNITTLDFFFFFFFFFFFSDPRHESKF